MPRRISRLGGTTLRRSLIVNAYSPAILCGLPQETPVLGHHAAVLDHVDARARELGGGALVADAELEPHGARLPRQREDLARVRRQERRAPEDLDDVHRL